MNALNQSPPLAGLFFLTCLLCAALVGAFARRRLPDRHWSEETTQFVRLLVTMLMTFSSIVVGLLVSSAKTSFDAADDQMHYYAVQLIELDRSLRDAGPAAEAIRQELRAYTAAAIAATWTKETPPAGHYAKEPRENPSDLDIANSRFGRMIQQVGSAIHDLPQDDLPEREARNGAYRQFKSLDQSRWELLSSENPRTPLPFLLTLLFWMAIVFASLGLTAPSNPVAAIVVLLGATAVASAMYVIIDLNILFDGGFFNVPSTYMRQALREMETP